MLVRDSEIESLTAAHTRYQSLACETAINTDFSELFSLKCIYVKYKNAILSLIDSFFRIWKDKTYGQVLCQIFNYYGETRSQDRTNQSTGLFVSFFHVQKKQSICDKIALLYLHKYFSEKIIHWILEKMCIFDSSNSKPETPLMDILYCSRFRMRVIGRCVISGK